MWRILFVVAAGLGGCHTAMLDDAGAMRGYLDDVRRETARHVEAVRSAATAPELRDEMTRHRNGMTPMMIDLDATMENMTSHCDGIGDMRAMHGELDREMDRHMLAVDPIADLDAAVAETDRHAGSMAATMDGMDGAMERMRCW